MDSAQNIIMMMRMEEKLTPIKIKTWASRTVSGCLDTRVRGNHVHLVTSNPIMYILFWQWKIPVVHWVLLPVGGKCEPCAITLDVMSPSVYMRWHLLNRDIFHLWYFL